MRWIIGASATVLCIASITAFTSRAQDGVSDDIRRLYIDLGRAIEADRGEDVSQILAVMTEIHASESGSTGKVSCERVVPRNFIDHGLTELHVKSAYTASTWSAWLESDACGCPYNFHTFEDFWDEHFEDQPYESVSWEDFKAVAETYPTGVRPLVREKNEQCRADGQEHF